MDRSYRKKRRDSDKGAEIILPNDVERINTLCHSSTTEAV